MHDSVKHAHLFDIQRGSLNDGPGIRTTFFFMYCPLRCEWCHNPESWEAHTNTSESDIVGGCSPESFAGKTYLKEELMEIALKDRHYYDESDGGVCLSGGEPLMQPDFIIDFLRTLKEKGVHTCVDTSGFASQEAYRSILPYTDLFLYDLKISDPEKHRKYTGKDNKSILRNLEFLMKQSRSELIRRCPVIPGVNDDRGHFRFLT